MQRVAAGLIWVEIRTFTCSINKMQKNWILKPRGDADVIVRLAKELDINMVLANLLVQRGISTAREAKAFFYPSLNDLHDPFLMKDMDIAIDRIEQAIHKKEKILIYGDYDVDGTTAVALMYTFLQQFGCELFYHIPNRDKEGYGISDKGIHYAVENGISLVIAVDCGTKAIDKVDQAAKQGIDFIICDHHRPGDELPKAVAILDPKRPDCHYPYDELSACGVGFKVIQAITKRRGLPIDALKGYLDFVVISIASDIVPLTGENRILAYYGLELLNKKQLRPGIEALIEVCGISKADKESDSRYLKELTINDLVFGVGPRINAAGRIKEAKASVELLVSTNLKEAKLLAETINNCNNERRNLDALTTQEAILKLEKSSDFGHNMTTILYEPNWHKGVIAIVASRLTEVYYRPTIVFCNSKNNKVFDGDDYVETAEPTSNLITGSARSIKEFDVYEAVEACSDLLEHFGGHKYAVGLSLKPENLPLFTERFEAYARKALGDKPPVPEIEIDANITLNELNKKVFETLKMFAPFGPGNPAPVFQTDLVNDTGYSRLVGKNHIKLSVIHRHISGYPISGIAFQMGDYFKEIANGSTFSIVYYIEENDYNGKVNLQINVKDIRIGKVGESNI